MVLRWLSKAQQLQKHYRCVDLSIWVIKCLAVKFSGDGGCRTAAAVAGGVGVAGEVREKREGFEYVCVFK